MLAKEVIKLKAGPAFSVLGPEAEPRAVPVQREPHIDPSLPHVSLAQLLTRVSRGRVSASFLQTWCWQRWIIAGVNEPRCQDV